MTSSPRRHKKIDLGDLHRDAHLLIAMGEVHEAVVVVVVVGALGRIGGQEQIVGAQAVALRVRVREDARLQQLVVRVADACACIMDVTSMQHTAGVNATHGRRKPCWPSQILQSFSRAQGSSARGDSGANA